MTGGLRVLYDGWIYSIQAAGGINRYFERLIRLMPSGWRSILVTEGRRSVNFPSHGSASHYVVPRIRWRRPLKPLGLEVEGLAVRWSTRGLEADLFHPTYYRCLPGMDHWRRRVPVVLSVMDMIHERFAELIDPAGQHAAEKAAAIAAADLVICPSAHTRSDLMEILDVPEERIRVVPLASEMASVEPAPVESAPTGPYFIYVGSRAPYKNFDALLESFRPLAARHRELRLCVVGTAWTDAERARMAELGLAEQIVLRVLPSDAELARLYRESIALVYPSMYEGFGIPPLEAMCCGTAVVTTSSSSIPEVVGDAALRVDPRLGEDLSAALELLLEKPDERKRWVEAGEERARHFSWERTVNETLSVYRSAVEERR